VVCRVGVRSMYCPGRLCCVSCVEGLYALYCTKFSSRLLQNVRVHDLEKKNEDKDVDEEPEVYAMETDGEAEELGNASEPFQMEVKS
jgi:hypothetical protein